jgi:hypothetical protein
MNRFLAASTLGLISILTLNAGQIQIGGATGITANYLLGTSSPTCTGGAIAYNPGFVSCLSTATYASTQGSAAANNASGMNLYGVSNLNTTAWATKTDSVMFQNASSSPAPGPITANGTIFDLYSNGGQAGIYADFGLNNGTVTPGLYTLTTPVGIADVSSVSTMLQDYWAVETAPKVGAGTAGQSTAVTFEFDTTSAGTSGNATYVTTYLTNGEDISTPLTCVTATGPGCSAFSGNGQGYIPTDILDTASASSLAASLAAAASTTNGIHETFTPNVYSAAFSGATLATASGYGAITAGNVQLDEQTFSFAGTPYANDFLVAVIIDNQMNPLVSKAALSAITVNQTTPEPSTILLLLTGLGSIGLGSFRRKK